MLEVITGSVGRNVVVPITMDCVGDWEGENARKYTEKNTRHLEITIAVLVAFCEIRYYLKRKCK